jgi:hypothetical protein
LNIKIRKVKKGCEDMTTKFDSKCEAITIGLYYAGMSDLCKDEGGKVKVTLEDVLKNP